MGNLSISPPYTPITDTIPPLPAGHDRLPQRDRPVGLEHQRLLGAVVGVDSRVPVRLHPDGVDAGIRPASPGQLLQPLQDALLLVVDRVGSPGLVRRHRQAVGEAVDRDHALGAEQLGAGDRELAHRSTAPDGDHVAALDVAHFGAHVAGWEDVGQEEDLLVRNPVRHLERPDVGERDPGILRLPSGEPAQHVRIPEQSRRRVAHQLFGHPGVRVGVLAQRPEVTPAHVAGTAGDRERHHDTIADLEVLHRLAGLDHLAHELVAEDIAFLHRRDEAVVQVQIGSADGRRGDANDRIAGVQDLRVGHLPDLEVLLPHPAVRFHRSCPPFADAPEGCAGCMPR